MSLQVWLPLNGNLDNKGIADISITNNGATINNGGKIGQCYYFDNTYAYSNLDYSDFGTDFTVAFWYKIDTAFGGNRHLICLANNWGWENLVFTCAATATNQFSFNIGNGNTSSRIITCPYVVGEWQHICFTFKNKNAKIYVNGVFLKSGTYSINPDWTKTQKIGLGGTPAGQEKSSTLYLNDVRVYNHCLSKKEIKEISKGLVLHYNFEDVIVPINAENIIYDSSGYGNDAQVVGKIQYSTDSKVGNYSLYFDGTSYNTRGYLTVLNKKAKLPITTVSLWAYSPDWQSTRKEKMISCTESGGWQLSHNDNAGKIGCPLYVNNGYRHLFAQNTEVSAGWHMFTFTWDGYDGYFYLDGEQKGTTYHSDNYAEITYNANNNILVGAEPRWRKYCIR